MTRHELFTKYLEAISGTGKVRTVPELLARLDAMIPELPMPELVADLQARQEAMEDGVTALAAMLAALCYELGLEVRDGKVVNNAQDTSDIFKHVGRLVAGVIDLAQGRQTPKAETSLFTGSSLLDVLKQVSEHLKAREKGPPGGPSQTPEDAFVRGRRAAETAAGHHGAVRESVAAGEDAGAPPEAHTEAQAVRSVN